MHERNYSVDRAVLIHGNAMSRCVPGEARWDAIEIIRKVCGIRAPYSLRGEDSFDVDLVDCADTRHRSALATRPELPARHALNAS